MRRKKDRGSELRVPVPCDKFGRGLKSHLPPFYNVCVCVCVCACVGVCARVHACMCAVQPPCGVSWVMLMHMIQMYQLATHI